QSVKEHQPPKSSVKRRDFRHGSDSEVPDFCDAIALHVRKSPKSRRYLSSAQGQIQRQNQLERPKSLPEVKMIDCTETATNLTQTLIIGIRDTRRIPTALRGG